MAHLEWTDLLAEHEALGGHTIARHIGKTESELRAPFKTAEDSRREFVPIVAAGGDRHFRSNPEPAGDDWSVGKNLSFSAPGRDALSRPNNWLRSRTSVGIPRLR